VPVNDEQTNMELYHAIPNIEGLSFNDVYITSGKSSVVNDLKKIQLLPSKESLYYNDDLSNSRGGDWNVHYNSTVRMHFDVTDTTSERVVEKAKNGALRLLNLSLDERSKIKGLKGYNGQTLGAGLTIVGTEQGNVKEIIGDLSIMGFTFKIHAGKKGIYASVKSPLAFKKAVTMATYGPNNYSLEVDVVVRSSIGQKSTIKTSTLKVVVDGSSKDLNAIAGKLDVQLVPHITQLD
jgi:hypothetical protein